MSIQSTKALLWIGSLALGGGLGYTVYDFLDRQADLGDYLRAEDYEPFLKEVEKPEPPKDDLIDYERVLATFHRLDWSGKKTVVIPTSTPGDDAPKVKPKIKVETLVAVLMTQVDTTRPERSTAYMQLLNQALIQNSPSGTPKLVFTVGDALPAPHADVKIEKIEPGLVTFAFDEEAREHESLVVKSADDGDLSWIVQLGPDDKVMTPTEDDASRIGQLEGIYKPQRSYLRSSGLATKDWVIGEEDKAIWANNYSEILANDVSYKRYRDPRTGKVTGVEITNVSPGSIAASHGVEAGMVVKSVNGHAVTSVSQAISYAKQNADTTSTWVIVYMKQGKEYTTTYHSD